MEKKLTNSGPLREPADKHSIYTMNVKLVGGQEVVEQPADRRASLEGWARTPGANDFCASSRGGIWRSSPQSVFRVYL